MQGLCTNAGPLWLFPARGPDEGNRHPNGVQRKRIHDPTSFWRWVGREAQKGKNGHGTNTFLVQAAEGVRRMDDSTIDWYASLCGDHVLVYFCLLETPLEKTNQRAMDQTFIQK